MSLSEAAWAEIARLWREGREPVGSIAARFEISRQRIVATARMRGWAERGAGPSAAEIERNDRTRQPAEQPSRRRLAPLPRTQTKRRAKTKSRSLQGMVERLFDAMEAKLSVIEQRMAEGADETSADSERTARAIGTLIRNLERLSEYERKLDKAQAAKGVAAGGERDDTERRRHELAQRIARLLERR